ncbi:MAG: hypothetical protein A2X59_04955 [Nitrospirae bacterium GWC2_42_7]|nr:MAG: hypothetical protein A2X59_04955 [Nitrospirae bacterium GWC2_42_7]
MQKTADVTEDPRDLKYILDAVMNLYSAHINSQMYSHTNPLISDLLRNAHYALGKAFRKNPLIHVEASDGKVMVDSKALKDELLVLQNYASWLNSRQIKALSFIDGLTRRELTNFHKLISSKLFSNEEFTKALAEEKITNIRIHFNGNQADDLSMMASREENINHVFSEYVSKTNNIDADPEKETIIADLPMGVSKEDKTSQAPGDFIVSTFYHIGDGQGETPLADLSQIGTSNEEKINQLVGGFESDTMDHKEGGQNEAQAFADFSDGLKGGETNINELSETEIEETDIPVQLPKVIQRTLENSDFVFDFIVQGGAVLHDIEIDGGSAGIFNESNLIHFQEDFSQDKLSVKIDTGENRTGFAATIIEECSEDIILGASFETILDLVALNTLENELFQKVLGKLTSLAGIFMEKGDFEKVLEIYNALKTQSLQGNNSIYAAGMIRSIFSTDQFNGKATEALKQYGRKKREAAGRLVIAMRSFLVPYLLEALNEETDMSKRRFMITLLTSIKDDSLPYIVTRLRDNRWYVLRNMLYLLRECQGRDYLPEIKVFLGHKVSLVRLEALRTLLSFHENEADFYIRKFLKSPVFQLQKGAVLLAGAYRMKNAVPQMIRLLKEKDMLGKRFVFKKRIIRMLGRIGDGSAVDQLLSICRSASIVHKNDLEKLKVEIFKTLHYYPSTVIGPILKYGTRSDNTEIINISRKLMKRYNLSDGEGIA